MHDTGRTTIRRVRAADAAAIAAIYDPIVAETAISFEEVPPGPDEIAARIAAAGDRYPWLACERAGRIDGFAYASAHRTRAAYRWSVDVSAYVASGARRRGVAAELYGRLFAILADRGYRSAYAGIAQPNDASVALHEKLGFRRIGVYHDAGFKLGRWRDVLWLERRLTTDTSRDVPPAEPRPLED